MSCSPENVDFEWIYENGQIVGRKARPRSVTYMVEGGAGSMARSGLSAVLVHVQASIGDEQEFQQLTPERPSQKLMLAGELLQ